MANEIQLYLDPIVYSGKTLTAKLHLLGVQIGSPIALVEVGTSGNFLGDMPLGLDSDKYAVLFFEGLNRVAHSEIIWDGTVEQELSDVAQQEIADTVDATLNPPDVPPIDPTPEYTIIENYFKGLYKNYTFSYFIKMNTTLRGLLEVELGETPPMTKLIVTALNVSIIIDGTLTGTDFIVYSQA